LPAQPSSGWGLYPTVDTHAERAHYRSDLLRAAQGPPTLAQGNCRSYGDACLYERVVSTLPLRHLLEFDSANGLLRAQAGCTLDKIIGYILPRGFFLPVTPGTKFPTLGGCLAADVHGKNHHSEGSIAAFVVDIDLVLADGGQITCSRTEHADVFWATLGGMGLTGLIYAATLRLKKISSAYMRTRTIKTQNFDELCQVFEQTQNEYTCSVDRLPSYRSKIGAQPAHARRTRQRRRSTRQRAFQKTSRRRTKRAFLLALNRPQPPFDAGI
jgi:decaprenylphospho-beta-D-ribofuranose 2-oxidase